MASRLWSLKSVRMRKTQMSMSDPNLPPTGSSSFEQTLRKDAAKAKEAERKRKIEEETAKDIIKGDTKSLKREIVGLLIGFAIIFPIFYFGASQSSRFPVELILLVSFLVLLLKAVFQYKGKL
jgi:hypothetical protein